MERLFSLQKRNMFRYAMAASNGRLTLSLWSTRDLQTDLLSPKNFLPYHNICPLTQSDGPVHKCGQRCEPQSLELC